MSRKVFVDTSAWVAISDQDEDRHPEAAQLYRDLLEGGSFLVISLPILAETHILLRRRLGFRAASAFLKLANESARIEILFPKSSHEVKAKSLLSRYHDQDFSLADAISFVLMQENGVKEAFTFDRHYATAGFTKIP